MKKFLIPLKDYERISKIIYSILKNEDADMEKSCLYYSFFGAHILKEHYKLDAKVRAGIAGYRLGNGEKNLLMFAEVVGGKLTCSENGFHCWVEVEGWLIDFMAPIFPNVMLSAGYDESCAPKMMQKKLGQMVESPDALSSSGEFFLSSHQDMMEELFEHFVSKSANTDLIEICSRWYKKPPKKMMKEISISDGKGRISNVQLKGRSVVGVW